MSPHLAALVPYLPGHAAGQRTRIETWAPHLEAAGWTVELRSFEDDDLHEVLYRPGRFAAKGARMVRCYARHLRSVAGGVDGDVVLVYREAALVGPALAERVLARRPAPLVYDIDDPVWIPYRSPTSSWSSVLKLTGKTRTALRCADQVITINAAIESYASGFNERVTVIPICADLGRFRPREPSPAPPVRAAWIGSHSSAANLTTIAAPLRRLQAEAPVVLRTIGAGEIPLPGVEVEALEWSPDTEVAHLGECHFGLVPLTDHPWNAWKFFYKTIQYMAMGLPVVGRGLGSNREIVADGVNGFVVETEDEWLDRMRLLATDADLRARMGRAARATVEERFPPAVHMPRVVSLFDEVYRRAQRRGAV